MSAMQYSPLRIPLWILALLLLAGNVAAAESAGELQRRDALLHYYKGWEGVAYEYGGLSKKGVDCSGFVYLALKHALTIEAPRSTELLANLPKQVKKSQLQVADVVLFRTARKTLHAGIYVGQGQFIHASKSKGVILSRLDNPYWQDVYLKSVRPGRK